MPNAQGLMAALGRTQLAMGKVTQRMTKKPTRMRRIVRYCAYSFLGLLAALSVVLLLAPAAGLYWADRWYQTQGNDYALHVGDWQFAPLTLSLSLQDVVLSHPPSETRVERLAFTMDPWALWQRQLHVHSLEIDGIDAELAVQPTTQLSIAGLTVPLTPSDLDAPSPAADALVDDDLSASSAAVNNPAFSNNPTLSNSQPASWSVVVDTVTLSNDRLRWTVGQDATPAEQMAGAFNIEQFSLNDFHWPTRPKGGSNALSDSIPVSIHLEASIEGFELQGATSLRLASPLALSVHGQLFDLDSVPMWQGDVRLADVQVQWQDQLALNIQQISLTQLLANSKQVVLDSLDVTGVQVSAIHADKPTLMTPVTEVHLQQYQAIKLFYGFASEEGDASFLTVAQQTLSGLNQITVLDQQIDPVYQGKITLHELTFGELNLNPQSGELEPMPVTLEIGLDDYNRMRLAGELGWVVPSVAEQNSYPQGALTLKTEQLNLVPFNGYLNQAMGYHAERGMLEVDAHINMVDANLTGEIKLLVRSSRFVPSDEKTMDRISKKISMPIDTALDLLRDKNGNVRLTVPLSGSLNDPDVGLNDLTAQLSQLALQKSAMFFVQQSLQPYTTLISLATYAGDYLFAIRLDALTFAHGQAVLTAEHHARLEKIAQMMRKKPELELSVCPFASEEEVEALGEQWTTLVKARGENVKAALAGLTSDSMPASLNQTAASSLAARVTLCKPQKGEKANVVLGVE